MSQMNHRRPGKIRRDGARYAGSPIGGITQVSRFADVTVGAGWGGDNADGHRGYATAKRGAKKFVRSRIRFQEKQQLARTVRHRLPESSR